MHTLLTLASLLLVFLGGRLALHLQSRLSSWSHRRVLQRTVLVLPLLSLGISLCGVFSIVWHTCLWRTCTSIPLAWDMLLSVGMVTMTLGALAWGVFRLLLLMWVMATTRGVEAPPVLRELVESCAAHLWTRQPIVTLVSSERPLAWTSGWLKPQVFISTWMIEHLDRRELEAVLMHEVAHIAQDDTLVLWLGRVLRDAFWYLPTSRNAYHVLQREKELACDDLVVEVTRRPLDLASALTKAWLHAVGEPFPSVDGLGQSLVGTDGEVEKRIERLLEASGSPTNAPRRVTRVVNSSMLRIIGMIEVLTFTLLLVLVACGPGIFL